eukprot:scaffold64204_cov63-Phaeocystis_antarctica.AAC.2
MAVASVACDRIASLTTCSHTRDVHLREKTSVRASSSWQMSARRSVLSKSRSVLGESEAGDAAAVVAIPCQRVRGSVDRALQSVERSPRRREQVGGYKPLNVRETKPI